MKKSYREGNSLQLTSGSLALLYVISFSCPAQLLQWENNPCLMELWFFVESVLFICIWTSLDRNGRNTETAGRALPQAVWHSAQARGFNLMCEKLPTLTLGSLVIDDNFNCINCIKCMLFTCISKRKNKISLFLDLIQRVYLFNFFMYRLQKSWSLNTWGKVYTLSCLYALARLLNAALDI